MKIFCNVLFTKNTSLSHGQIWIFNFDFVRTSAQNGHFMVLFQSLFKNQFTGLSSTAYK